MTTTTSTTIWVCLDCYFAHHGYGDGELGYTPDREPLSLIGDSARVFSGMTWDEHECDPVERESNGCECDEMTFSWHPCQGCGSTLGGSRHALTVDSD